MQLDVQRKGRERSSFAVTKWESPREAIGASNQKRRVEKRGAEGRTWLGLGIRYLEDAMKEVRAALPGEEIVRQNGLWPEGQKSEGKPAVRGEPHVGPEL